MEETAFPLRPGRELQTLEDVIGDLLRRQSQLTGYLEEKILADELKGPDLARLLTLHGQNATRIGRLLRDQRALRGETADDLLAALATALDELGAELGIEL